MAQKFELKTYIPQGYKFLSKNLFKRKTEISLDELRNEFEDSQYIYDYHLNIKVNLNM